MVSERFDHFMARANQLYYASHNPFEDFVTSPEISQVFGEILGAWAKTVWQMMGAPVPFILAEAGPGRGTMMADILRGWPGLCPHFIETSPRLRAQQAELVPHAVWHDDLSTLPAGPLILLANEFLDALPVRQFIRRENGWMERYVLGHAYEERQTDYRLPDDDVGTVREVNEAAIDFCKALERRNAVGLFVDYGPSKSAEGASVQAISDGRYGDVLAVPGSADITAHVDFAAIADVVHSQGPVKQNEFLTALGFFQRTDYLARKYPNAAATLQMAAQRLTAPEAMGGLFKVFAVCPQNFPPLPGFVP
ncbi:MAG: SAM-dependent methyltransferase [Acidocella sp.]|nr:SAM-dependent methyltransferase [Acidocella sp.]